MSKIIISKTHNMGENQLPLFWAFHVPEKSKAFEIVEIDGYRVAQTTRNYYYAKSTDQKIHFKHMTAENSSAKFYRDLYIEVKPGVFSYVDICTDSNIDTKMNNAVARAKALDTKRISEWSDKLQYLN